MGDFNVPTPEKMTKPKPGRHVDFWKGLESANLKDMGPEKDSGTFWGNGQDIDSVLATGFKPVASEILKGAQDDHPRHNDAKEVSDHYAEADNDRLRVQPPTRHWARTAPMRWSSGPIFWPDGSKSLIHSAL